jgi:hypothetical protein
LPNLMDQCTTEGLFLLFQFIAFLPTYGFLYK